MKSSKKRMLSDFEAFIQKHAQTVYRAAYAVKGERIGAEKLAEDAMLLGAKRYGDLMNKERALDIILEKIGAGTAVGFEPTDLTALCERVVARAYVWHARKTVFLRVLTGMLVIALCIGIAFPLLPNMAIPTTKDVLQMENAAVVKGESENVELVNYQPISKVCAFNQENFNTMFTLAGADRIVAAVTAPDGTPYAAINNLESLDGSNTTFTLYRGNEKGWEPVATAEIGAGRQTFPGTAGTLFQCSELYVYADKDSDVYVFLRVDTEVRIWRYDSETGAFEQKQTVPFAKLDTNHTMEARFDPNEGEKGTAYFSCNHAGVVKIYRYDTATDTLSPMTDDLRIPKNTNFIFCVKNGTVYGVTEANSDVYIYQVLADGTVKSRELPVTKEKFGYIEIDGESNVHMLTNNFKHYIVKPDMSFSAANVERFYYRDTDYIRVAMGAYIGKDGKFYYLENYIERKESEACFVAIGRLDGDDPAKAELVDSLYLLDNVLMTYFFKNGKDITFVAAESYPYDNPYVVYFHVGETQGED